MALTSDSMLCISGIAITFGVVLAAILMALGLVRYFTEQLEGIAEELEQ